MSAEGKPSTFPAPIYRDEVLSHVFADAQHHLLPTLLEIDRAHLVMLREQQILSAETAAACAHALDLLDLEALRSVPYDGSVEDLFFLLERELARLAGAEHAGRLHTARSRNDIDLTLYRMVLRERLLTIVALVTALRTTLLQLAAHHRAALLPAYTHNQPAQPTTLGHYLLAMVEVLERDTERLIACYGRVNRSPLGACAITTTSFPILRERTAELLGFRGLVLNSYGAIAAVDYIAEAAGVLATSMLSLGRFTQDLLLWTTAEFNFLRLSDGYVQRSSIMPQKRNPVALEHTRVLASRALTEAQSVLNALHNTPFADMNDAEDSLQPLATLAFADAARALTLLNGALSEATFHTRHMAEGTHHHFLTVTEAADTLVRLTGISFARAHALVAATVNGAQTDDLASLAHALHSRTTSEDLSISLADLQQALDPAHFVAIRNIPGGPGPLAMEAQLQAAQSTLAQDAAWHSTEREHLSHAQQTLRTACDGLQR